MLFRSVNKRVPVVSGTPTTATVNVARICELSRLVVVQADGTTAGFTATFYDCDPDDTSDGLSANSHKVAATMTADSGENIVELYGAAAAFANTEIDADDVSKRNKSQLYVTISALGSGVKNFDIGISYSTAD